MEINRNGKEYRLKTDSVGLILYSDEILRAARLKNRYNGQGDPFF